jgi:hypothetical protein
MEIIYSIRKGTLTVRLNGKTFLTDHDVVFKKGFLIPGHGTLDVTVNPQAGQVDFDFVLQNSGTSIDAISQNESRNNAWGGSYEV